MNARKLAETDGVQTFVLVFDAGETVTAPLLTFAREHAIDAASFSGIGAFERVTLGYFELQKRDYKHIEVNEQVEVVSLIGNIAAGNDGPRLHAHVVVGRSNGSAFGGHLIEGRVRPTLEIMLVETPSHLKRRSDPATGLALIDVRRS